MLTFFDFHNIFTLLSKTNGLKYMGKLGNTVVIAIAKLKLNKRTVVVRGSAAAVRLRRDYYLFYFPLYEPFNRARTHSHHCL